MMNENQDSVLVRISMHAHEFRDGFTVLNSKIDQISKVQNEDAETPEYEIEES